ncbi:MAG: class I SAM-dependent methyltransferase [Actinobacteria bacterium]|nr:class I SAM-dependent methyltransferase [Actinomycetota bacterium]
MTRYRAVIDPAIRNSSQTLAVEFVGADKDVLDVGCAAGDLARALNNHGCRVSGIELDPDLAREAEPDLVELVVGDVGELDLSSVFPAAGFDVVVCGDVLEHLVDPESVLRALIPLLRPDGELVVSVPNVTHGSLRLALLEGRWRYTDEGLLDNTHLRFFTRESLIALLAGVGLEVVELRATVMDALKSEVDVDASMVPGAIIDWVRAQPDAEVYQFVLRARRGSSDVVPELVPAVELEPVGRAQIRVPQDERTWLVDRDELLDELRELRHTVLTLRDHAVGMAAQTGAAEARAHRASVELLEAEDALKAARRSRSYRLGNLVMAPMARIFARRDAE